MTLMTVAQFAKHRGVTRQGIYESVKSGRLTRRSDGLIDRDAGDRELDSLTDPARSFAASLRQKKVEPPPDMTLAEYLSKHGFVYQIEGPVGRHFTIQDQEYLKHTRHSEAEWTSIFVDIFLDEYGVEPLIRKQVEDALAEIKDRKRNGSLRLSSTAKLRRYQSGWRHSSPRWP